MQLKTYLKRQGLTTESFAVMSGLSQSEVSRLANGRRLPSAATISKIEKATGGAVRKRDFSTLKKVQEVPFQ
jgi:transcriptional regulator with XRE-family HTH domain